MNDLHNGNNSFIFTARAQIIDRLPLKMRTLVMTAIIINQKRKPDEIISTIIDNPPFILHLFMFIEYIFGCAREKKVKY